MTNEQPAAHEAAGVHETAAVLRMQRAGMLPYHIAKLLGISSQQLVHELNSAIDDENEAHHAGMGIYDSPILAKVDAISKSAKDVLNGEYLLGHSFVKSVVNTPASYTINNQVLMPGSTTLEFVDGTRVSFLPTDPVRVAKEPAPITEH